MAGRCRIEKEEWRRAINYWETKKGDVENPPIGLMSEAAVQKKIIRYTYRASSFPFQGACNPSLSKREHDGMKEKENTNDKMLKSKEGSGWEKGWSSSHLQEWRHNKTTLPSTHKKQQLTSPVLSPTVTDNPVLDSSVRVGTPTSDGHNMVRFFG